MLMSSNIAGGIEYNERFIERYKNRIRNFVRASARRHRELRGIAAATQGAALIRAALEKQGYATIIVATGASQFNILEQLVREELDWSKVEAFHLDEYVGLPVTHPASLCKYLKERFVERVPQKHFVITIFPEIVTTMRISGLGRRH